MEWSAFEAMVGEPNDAEVMPRALQAQVRGGGETMPPRSLHWAPEGPQRVSTLSSLPEKALWKEKEMERGGGAAVSGAGTGMTPCT
jgi:hypothetical protein